MTENYNKPIAQFRENGSWQTTDNYFPEELGELKSVVDQVSAFVAEKESEDGEETVPVEE